MTNNRSFIIETDTGLTALVERKENFINSTTAELKKAVGQYGNWIYKAGGEAVQWEYKNHWLPKLNAAKKITIKFNDN